MRCKRLCQKRGGSRARRRRPLPIRGPHPSTPRDRRRRFALGNRLSGKCAMPAPILTARSAAWAWPRKRGADRRERCSPRHRAASFQLANNVRASGAAVSRAVVKKCSSTRVHMAPTLGPAAVAELHAAAGRLRLGDCPRRQQVPSQGLLALGADTSRRQVRLSGKACTRCQDGLLGGAGFMCDVLKEHRCARAPHLVEQATPARRSSAAAAQPLCVRPRAGRWCRSPQASDHQSLRLGNHRGRRIGDEDTVTVRHNGATTTLPSSRRKHRLSSGTAS